MLLRMILISFLGKGVERKILSPRIKPKNQIKIKVLPPRQGEGTQSFGQFCQDVARLVQYVDSVGGHGNLRYQKISINTCIKNVMKPNSLADSIEKEIHGSHHACNKQLATKLPVQVHQHLLSNKRPMGHIAYLRKQFI